MISISSAPGTATTDVITASQKHSFVCCTWSKYKQATHHAQGRTQASSELHLVVFHDVGQQLPPIVALGDSDGCDRGKPQVLQENVTDRWRLH